MNWRHCAFALACLLLPQPAASSAQALPEGRAYEQVTPVDKNGGDVGGPALEGVAASAFGQSAADGNSIGYVSLSSFADSRSGELFKNYISARGRDGWSTHSISPPAAVPSRFVELSPFRFFANDLSVGLLEWSEPALAEGAPPGFRELYICAVEGTCRALVHVAPPSMPALFYHLRFAGASPDLGRVVIEANDALTPGAPALTDSVYEWAGSALRLVSVLPGPGDVAANRAGAGDGNDDDFADVISDDGSRIFWTDAARQLYVRENGTRTVKLNASRRPVSLGDGTATLLATTPDGSTAIFTDPTAISDDPGDSGGGIYAYDVDAESLRDLTPNAPGDPGVQGVLGMSDSGSTIYFVASAALAGGASAGAMNLYVVRGGAIEFIAGLSPEDSGDWTTSFEARTARITPDGAHLAFLSTTSLTGYDNTDAITGEPDRELFVYDAGEGRLICVSCNPGGTRPTGSASMPLGTNSSYEPRVLSADGSQVLFNSADALVTADGNGRQDVYEYVDGRPQLISTGTSGDASALVDMSADGRDVFFTTRSRLVATDRDNGSDIYDARLGGGFPIPVDALTCSGEACRGPLSPPAALGPVATGSGVDEGMTGRGPGRPRTRCRRRLARGEGTTRSKRCGRAGGRTTGKGRR